MSKKVVHGLLIAAGILTIALFSMVLASSTTFAAAPSGPPIARSGNVGSAPLVGTNTATSTTGAFTATRTRTATRTITVTPTPTDPNCPPDYIVTTSVGATMVPGTTLLPGTQCDECTKTVPLPFPVSLYDQSFSSANLTANGQLVFGLPVDPSFSNICLPDPYSSYSIFLHWTDLTMDTNYVACGACGVYSSVSGAAPNRIYNLEWRAVTFDFQLPVNFEVRLYESAPKFDLIYGTVQPSVSYTSTIGVQEDRGNRFTQISCPDSPAVILPGTMYTFTYASTCPTPVPTDTPSNTATDTPTFTPTQTATQRAATNTPTDVPTSTAIATDTATTQPTYTPTSAPDYVTIVGHVTLQGRGNAPSARWVIPVSGSLALVGGGPYLDYTTTLDNSGYFTVTTNLAPGNYLWRIKNAQTLANGGQVTLPSGTTTVEMGLLREGDANNDNCIRVTDFNIVKISYGHSLGETNYDARADFTGDNTVSVLDFNIIKVNYSQCGEPPITPTGTPTATATSTPATTLLTGHVTLLGRTAQPSTRQSVPITLTLRLVSGGPDTNYSTNTDVNGVFTVTAPGPGTYNYRVKNPQTLANSGTLTLAAGANSVEMGQLREGDANNDNCIRVVDFNIVKVAYGHSLGDPGYDARADFTGDNTISVLDFNLLKTGYSLCGALPITPGGEPSKKGGYVAPSVAPTESYNIILPYIQTRA